MEYPPQAGLVSADVQEALKAASRLKSLSESAHSIFQDFGPVTEHQQVAWHELSQTDQVAWAFDLCNGLWLEGWMPTPRVLTILTPPAAEALTDAINDYHDALPFSSAERHWLVGEYDRTDPDSHWGTNEGTVAAVSHIVGAEDVIVDRGRQRPVRGEELIQRWWAWRRGVEEFEEDGAYELTRDALRRIVNLVRPERSALTED
jgi:hypothetical protein